MHRKKHMVEIVYFLTNTQEKEEVEISLQSLSEVSSNDFLVRFLPLDNNPFVSELKKKYKADTRFSFVNKKFAQRYDAFRYSVSHSDSSYIWFLSENIIIQKQEFESLLATMDQKREDILFFNFKKDEEIRNIQDERFFSETGNVPSEKFNLQSLPNRIYNVMVPYFECNFFSRKFLEKNMDIFTDAIDVNEIYFLFIAWTLAKSIDFFNREVVTIGKAKEKKKDYTEFQEIVDVLSNERIFLSEHNIISLVERSFLNYVLVILRNLLETLKEPSKSLMLDLISRKIIHYFGYESKNSFFFYNMSDYQWLTSLKSKHSIPRLSNFLSQKKDHILPILLTVMEDSDILHLAPTIQSIIEHANPSFFYDIYILYCKQISPNLIYIIENMSVENVRICAYDVHKSIPEELGCYRHFGLLACNALPDYNLALYLDYNIVIQDLASFLDVNIDKFYCAATLAHRNEIRIEESMGLAIEEYATFGTVLLNLDLWRKKAVVGKCRKLFKEKLEEKWSLDDIINVVCKNKIYYLDDSWNCQYTLLKKNVLADYPKNYDDMKVLDYNFNEVWYHPDNYWFFQWWKYARKTPCYEVLLAQYSEWKYGKLKHEENAENNKDPQLLKDTNAPIQKNEIQTELENIMSDFKNITLEEVKNPSFSLKEIRNNLDALYPFLRTYIKESLFCIFSGGKQKSMHKEKMRTTLKQIESFCRNE
mgnify:CR=1 FL=1